MLSKLFETTKTGFKKIEAVNFNDGSWAISTYGSNRGYVNGAKGLFSLHRYDRGNGTAYDDDIRAVKTIKDLNSLTVQFSLSMSSSGGKNVDYGASFDLFLNSRLRIRAHDRYYISAYTSIDGANWNSVLEWRVNLGWQYCSSYPILVSVSPSYLLMSVGQEAKAAKIELKGGDNSINLYNGCDYYTWDDSGFAVGTNINFTSDIVLSIP